MHTLVLIGLAVSVAFAGVGCSSSDEGANDSMGSEISAGGTGIASSSGGKSATGGSAAITVALIEDYDPIAACKAEAASHPKPACASCACEHCLIPLIACQTDPTCLALSTCVQSSGCGCEDKACILSKCESELTEAGGFAGAGTQKGIDIINCTNGYGCNCC